MRDYRGSQDRNCMTKTVPSTSTALTSPSEQLLSVDEQCQQLLSDRSSFYCSVSMTTTTTTTTTTTVIRPHRTYYVRRSGPLLPTDCRSVTLVSLAKTAEPTKMPFRLRTWVGRGNHVLDGNPHPHGEGAILLGRGGPL